MSERMVTRVELAEILTVSVTTIDRWRRQGMPSITLGMRLVRFDPIAAARWAVERAPERTDAHRESEDAHTN